MQLIIYHNQSLQRAFISLLLYNQKHRLSTSSIRKLIELGILKYTGLNDCIFSEFESHELLFVFIFHYDPIYVSYILISQTITKSNAVELLSFPCLRIVIESLDLLISGSHEFESILFSEK